MGCDQVAEQGSYDRDANEGLALFPAQNIAALRSDAPPESLQKCHGYTGYAVAAPRINCGGPYGAQDIPYTILKLSLGLSPKTDRPSAIVGSGPVRFDS